MFTTKQSIDITPPPSHTNNISFISLPSELLCQIFSHFDHNLKPSSSSYFPSSTLHDHSTSTPFNLSPSISQATPSTLFNYPSYLKHLDYYGLIVSIKRFLSLSSLYTFDQSSDITCNDGVLSIPRSPTSVNDKALVLELQQEKSKNYLIKRFLKLFYDNNSIITSLIIDTDDETTCSLGDEEYLLWYNNEDKNDRLLFKNLKNLIVKANFCQDNLFFKLKDVCKNLLYGFECFTELILPSLIYQSHSLQTLILEYLDFNDCNNDSLTSILNCRKLQVLKFIGCTNLKKETFKCLEKSATNTSNSSDYWSELKDVCVTPNMCVK
ncbi:1091_t:CDS:2 [Entrophospora sp. SA101]|nr:14632_t:CDS:2 [Entrophospora sp. SA101]CAJ0847024.1 1091_t:CDS:2 [Entrophospora sp. SA101]